MGVCCSMEFNTPRNGSVKEQGALTRRMQGGKGIATQSVQKLLLSSLGNNLFWLPTGGCRKHNFWTTRVKSIKNYYRNAGVESYQLVYIWVRSEGGGSGVVQSSLDPPPRIYWATPTTFLISLKSSAQAQSIGTLFEQIGLRGGLWTCPKVRGTRAQVQAAG